MMLSPSTWGSIKSSTRASGLHALSAVIAARPSLLMLVA